MAGKTVQQRRGTTVEHASFAGAVAEITVDTDKSTVVVHDGATPGGTPMLRAEDAYLKGETYSRSEVEAYVQGEIPDIQALELPEIALPASAPELSMVELVINNYQPGVDYHFTVDSGSVSQGYPYKWYLGQVGADTLVNLSVNSTQAGKLGSPTARHSLTIMESGSALVGDDIFIIQVAGATVERS